MLTSSTVVWEKKKTQKIPKTIRTTYTRRKTLNVEILKTPRQKEKKQKSFFDRFTKQIRYDTNLAVRVGLNSLFQCNVWNKNSRNANTWHD